MTLQEQIAEWKAAWYAKHPTWNMQFFACLDRQTQLIEELGEEEAYDSAEYQALNDRLEALKDQKRRK